MYAKEMTGGREEGEGGGLRGFRMGAGQEKPSMIRELEFQPLQPPYLPSREGARN